MASALHEDQYTSMIIRRSVLLRMRNVADKAVEKIKTNNLCSIIYAFRKSCHL